MTPPTSIPVPSLRCIFLRFMKVLHSRYWNTACFLQMVFSSTLSGPRPGHLFTLARAWPMILFRTMVSISRWHTTLRKAVNLAKETQSTNVRARILTWLWTFWGVTCSLPVSLTDNVLEQGYEHHSFCCRNSGVLSLKIKIKTSNCSSLPDKTLSSIHTENQAH